jgi:hypothetical protein
MREPAVVKYPHAVLVIPTCLRCRPVAPILMLIIPVTLTLQVRCVIPRKKFVSLLR